MRRNVTRKVYNDRKNVSAVTLHVFLEAMLCVCAGNVRVCTSGATLGLALFDRVRGNGWNVYIIF